ncbi:hypothetical protein BS47DRAFT_236725 [Hydnum rufescens UP504]|uniref:Uncharacterized protein n=1 Tax=Hydnum rufescens UP504 TaxID=1448309 RepID=A0A9P6AM38_9AGAM|nr:hypothetical protein BS47DRAFT_236725 [Hydnum rufescens UP504]
MKNPKIYPWAVGHTAASWRERYKTKPAYMDDLIEKHLRSKTGQDRPRLAVDPGNSSGSGAQRKAKSEPVATKKRKAPTSESDDEAVGRQRKIPRPPSLSPDDQHPKRGSSIVDAIDVDEPGQNIAVEEEHAVENQPSLPPEPAHDVPDGDSRPILVLTKWTKRMT